MNEPTSPSTTHWLSFAVALAAVAALALVVMKALVPAHSEVRKLEQTVARLQQESAVAQKEAAAEREQVAQLLKHRDSLSKEASETKQALSDAIAEKRAALAELDAAKAELSQNLGTQIAAGDVLITERDGELVVDVADRLLFETGQADVSEAGKEFLHQVADSLRRLPRKQVFQVAGHTDSQRVVSKELLERFPTNWELSATRATNVTRFLQEKGRIPGRQLVAAGYAEHRPSSTNQSEAGRRKNRRIEITLLRTKP